MTAHLRSLSRRRFLRDAGALGVAAAAFPLLAGCRTQSKAAGAARSGKMPLVGYLALHPLDRGNLAPGGQRLLSVPNADAFRQGLLDLGYVEGKTIRPEYRFAGDSTLRLDEVAHELVHMPVDVLVAADTASLQSVSGLTRTIPIITAFSGDPIAGSLVASLARPGGNVTGPSDLSLELAAKRLEILLSAVPTLRHAGVFWNPTLPDRQLAWQQTQTAGHALGVQTSSFEVRIWEEFETAFAAAKAARIDAFLSLDDPVIGSGYRNLVAFQNSNRIPGAGAGHDWLSFGGFLTYGVDENDLFRRVAGYVERVLKGAKPADLPVDRAARFSLVFNVSGPPLGLENPHLMGGSFGLEVPQSILTQATTVIR